MIAARREGLNARAVSAKGPGLSDCLAVLAGVDPHECTLILAEHVEVGLLQPRHRRRRLFPNSDASFRNDCNEQGTASFMDGVAIPEPFQLRGRKAGHAVHMLWCSQGFGPPGLSFHLEYSLQGGASIRRAINPDQHSLSRASKTVLSRISCSRLWSKSKGSKQSKPRLTAAEVTGCNRPAKTSSRSPPSCFVACRCLLVTGFWLLMLNFQRYYW